MIVLWLPVAAGVLIGKIWGGRLTNVTTIQLRAVWLLIGIAAAQTALVFAPPQPPEASLDALRIVLAPTTAAMAVFVWLNRRLPGMKVVLGGVLANLAVITANGGLMPTNADAMARAGMDEALQLAQRYPGIRIPKSKDVLLSWEETRLPWLSDALVSPVLLTPLPRRKVFSAGDLLIAAGIATLTTQAVRGKVARRDEPAPGAAGVPGARDETSEEKEELRGSPQRAPIDASSAVGIRPAHPHGVIGGHGAGDVRVLAAGAGGSAGISGTPGTAGVAGAYGPVPTGEPAV